MTRRRTVKVEVHGERPPAFTDFVERYHEHHAGIEAPVWSRRRTASRSGAAVTGTLRLICLGYLRPTRTIDAPDVYLEDLEPRRRRGKVMGERSGRLTNPVYLSPEELSILVQVVGYDLELGRVSREDAARCPAAADCGEVDRGLAPELTDPTNDELGRYARGAVAELVRRLACGGVDATLGASEGAVRFTADHRPTSRTWGMLAETANTLGDNAAVGDYLAQVDGRRPTRFPRRLIWDRYLSDQGLDVCGKTAWYHQLGVIT